MSAEPPLFAEALALLRAGDLAGGAAVLEQFLAGEPEHAEARYRLGKTYCDLYRLADAERELRRVMKLRPNDPSAYSALGLVLQSTARGREAMLAHEEAMRLDPTNVTVATNWLNAQQYVDDVTEAQLAESHRRWAALHAPPPRPIGASNPRKRPLTVGFLSPDLAGHPVGRLTVRLFENLDRTSVRALVFSTRPAAYEDDISRRIARAAQWASVDGLSDDSLARFIGAARPDILIDMSGHTAHHRLKVFAARAAPLQVSWLGYTGTTGIPAMDYVLATPVLAPPGSEAFYCEKIYRLPRWLACFDPPEHAPEVGPLPAARNGFITFGCFNNPAKIGDGALASFAAVLRRLPTSRLVLRYQSLASSETRARLREAFAAHGVDAERIDMAGNLAGTAFLEAYNGVDIALDTFPYSGAMTTCEATWMGCPVVTVRGATFAGRQSAAFLTAAGFADLVAETPRAFEDLAARLAGDTGDLANLRAQMRRKIAASPVCDAPGFARDFTAAMQAMWFEAAGGRGTPA